MQEADIKTETYTKAKNTDERVMNVHCKGTPFLYQTTEACGSAAALHDILTVSPFVTFML